MIDEIDGETQGLSLKGKRKKTGEKADYCKCRLGKRTDDISSQMVDIQYTHIYVHILNTCAS